MRRRFSAHTHIDIGLPLYIEALEDGVYFSFPRVLQISKDNRIWETLEEGIESPVIHQGERFFISGNFGGLFASDLRGFTINGVCKIGGDLRSLSYGNNYYKVESLHTDFLFARVFASCTSIKEVEIDFSLIKGLTIGCYSSMFENCTALTAAPELPVTTLVANCYEYMFQGCTSLTTAPELPATTLAYFCYARMFEGCSKLNYIKMLATDISVDGCLDYWVNGVASTGTFVKSKDATWDVVGDSGVPSGWTVITDDQEGGIDLITFTVGDTEYQAEQGMTWEEFINSPYNNGEFSLNSSGVVRYDAYFLTDGIGDSQDKNDVIINGESYYIYADTAPA